MANYQGLNCIMREITMMASNEKNPIHEQHIYDYFTVTEKFVRTAVPQLVADYLDQFREKPVVEFETYFIFTHLYSKVAPPSSVFTHWNT